MTDGDQDTDEDSAEVNVTASISIEDDGPEVDVAASGTTPSSFHAPLPCVSLLRGMPKIFF